MASDSASSFDRVRELIRSQLIDRALPSLAVAVAREGAIVWEEGFGWADRERRVPATRYFSFFLYVVFRSQSEKRHTDEMGRPARGVLQ